MSEQFFVKVSYDGSLIDVKSFIAKNKNMAIHSAKRYYSDLFGNKYASKCRFYIIKD